LLFMGRVGTIQAQHHAFLVSETEFDAVMARIRERELDHWADPYHRKSGAINTDDGGRGVYFHDPDDHDLEVMTRPYGSGGG
ncbi:MAG: VOC family protein, partial [Gluconacetobacter diazotrophicus]|nr:VOC family protein [Gluconacetobacter diazotrophicus]